MNGKQQSQQQQHNNSNQQFSNSHQSGLNPQGQQQHGNNNNYSSSSNMQGSKANHSNQSQNQHSASNSQPQSPQNSQNSGSAAASKDQQAVTKQGSVEKQKTKKDKGPNRDDVLKKVAQFINESLLEKNFIEKLQATRNVDDTDEKEELITDSHNNNNGSSSNGHTNGDAEIIEECSVEENGVSSETETKESVGGGNEESEVVVVVGEEENSVPSMEDVVKLYYELKVPDKFLKDSNVKILNESLDKGETTQDTVIEFLMALQKDKKLTSNQTLDAFRGVISGMSEREKTIPKVTTHVAALLARSMMKKICKLTDVANFTDNGQHYPLLLLVLQQLNKTLGEEQLVEMFNNSKINLMGNLPECDRSKDRLAEILDDRKLSFLQPLLRIESELWRQIKEDPQPQTFYKWIKDNVDSARYTDPGFITALTTVLLKYITQVSS
jgi:translation initiation factor 4G